jgi:hypothetical protein
MPCSSCWEQKESRNAHGLHVARPRRLCSKGMQPDYLTNCIKLFKVKLPSGNEDMPSTTVTTSYTSRQCLISHVHQDIHSLARIHTIISCLMCGIDKQPLNMQPADVRVSSSLIHKKEEDLLELHLSSPEGMMRWVQTHGKPKQEACEKNP